MKKFLKIFLICYIITSVFFVFFWGNVNFFGEHGFHMDVDTFFNILITWAFFSALIISGIIYIVSILIKKIKK